MSRLKHISLMLAALAEGAVFAAPLVPTAPSVGCDTAALQSAIDRAPAGSVVELGAGVFRINAQLTVDHGVILRGQGRDKTVIRQTVAKATEDARCVLVDGGARLEGITLSGGWTISEPGAGVLVRNGSVVQCGVVSNRIEKGSVGAGVSFSGGKGTLDRCVIADNLIVGGGYGAGIGGRTTVGAVLIDTCLVYGNDSAGGSAGGVGFDGPSAAVTVRSSTVVANSANYGAGGIVFTNGTGRLVLVNDLVARNTMNVGETNLNLADGSVAASDSRFCFFGLPGEADRVADSQYGNPPFVSEANRDYHLRASTEVGYEDLSGDAVDLDGADRLGRIDVGCYERVTMPRSAILTFR